MNHKIFLLYDGMSNSVFHGQVLVPLIKQLSQNPDLKITLVSFERNPKVSGSREYDLIDKNVVERVKIICLKKIPFFGELSLWPAVSLFRKLYKKLYDTIGVDECVARGPFAGWIARKSIGSKRMPGRFVIQARGLAAEEFRYTHEATKNFSIFYKLRLGLIRQIEFESYSNVGFSTSVLIEAVSDALKEYLEKKFYVDPKKIVVSRADIPGHISSERVLRWRKEVREEFAIDRAAYVYCYAGSAHAWQGVDDMLNYFARQYEKNKRSVLLVLSQDEKVFREKLKMLKRGCYRIKSVSHASVARYLSAGDAGLLFRDSDPVNWVSRPTKMLEYQSVGLKIVHNATVASLCD